MTSAQATTGAPAIARRGALALVVIALSQLIIMLDATIVTVALPQIQQALGFATTSLSWVVNAYSLTAGGLLLLGGRVGDIVGRRRTLVAGIVVFSVASLIGGFATGPGLLVAARAAQGVGTAIIGPGVLALIATSFADETARNRAFGVFAAVSGIGASIGLILGGVLTAALSWRWVLFVNVPIGILLIALIPLCIPETTRQPGRFDVGGALTSTLGMTSLVYAFIRAGQAGWGDGLTLAAFGAAVVLLGLFVLLERGTAQPIVPLRLFVHRNRTTVYFIGFALTGAFIGMFFFLTLFLQRVLGYEPLLAGVAFLPATVAILITAGITSKQLPRWGQKAPMLIGIVLIAVALGWLALLRPGSGYVDGLLGPMLLFGVGNGLLFIPMTMVGVSGVSMEESGAASSTLQATQLVGGALGLAVLLTVFAAATGGGAVPDTAQLTKGASTAFGVAAIFAVVAAVLTALVIRIPASPAAVPAAERAEAITE